MPELPEVETTRRGIAGALQGHRVFDVIVRERRLRWPIPANFEASIRGQIVSAIERRAKYILLRLERGTVILHLGMSGSLRILGADSPVLAHDHWDIVVDSGAVLRFHDPRRFGSLHWTEGDAASHPLLARLAPEPLSGAFDGDYLFRATRRRTVAVKQLIMDSKVVVGVGNIYASEALFRAGISPRRAAGRLSRAHTASLASAIRDVLTDAIRIGGTTLRDYVSPEGTPGYFRQELYVYERGGQACRVCRSPIRQIIQGQRSTYFCRGCQH